MHILFGQDGTQQPTHFDPAGPVGVTTSAEAPTLPAGCQWYRIVALYSSNKAARCAATYFPQEQFPRRRRAPTVHCSRHRHPDPRARRLTSAVCNSASPVGPVLPVRSGLDTAGAEQGLRGIRGCSTVPVPKVQYTATFEQAAQTPLLCTSTR